MTKTHSIKHVTSCLDCPGAHGATTQTAVPIKLLVCMLSADTMCLDREAVADARKPPSWCPLVGGDVLVTRDDP